MGTIKFNIDKIAEYLDSQKKNLEGNWNKSSMLKSSVLEKLGKFLSGSELEQLRKAENRFLQEVELKKLLEKKIAEFRKNDKVKYGQLCLWIIQDWGGIVSRNDNATSIVELIDGFYDRKHLYRISSTSKVASFEYPKEHLIYDSRVAYSLNWIILSQNAGDKFFPIPSGRNSKMRAFDLNALIRLENICKYIPKNRQELENKKFINEIDKELYIAEDKAYSELRDLIIAVNKKLWKDDNVRMENLYYTEMLLFAMADREIYDDIVKSVKLTINHNG